MTPERTHMLKPFNFQHFNLLSVSLLSILYHSSFPNLKMGRDKIHIMNLLEILNMINAQQVCHSVCHKARRLSLCLSISVLPLLLYKIDFFLLPWKHLVAFTNIRLMVRTLPDLSCYYHFILFYELFCIHKFIFLQYKSEVFIYFSVRSTPQEKHSQVKCLLVDCS